MTGKEACEKILEKAKGQYDPTLFRAHVKLMVGEPAWAENEWPTPEQLWNASRTGELFHLGVLWQLVGLPVEEGS